MKRLVPVAFAALLLLAACGGSDEGLPAGQETAPARTGATGPSPVATKAPTPSAVPASGANQTYTDTTYGYSFDYPAAWYLSPPKDNGGSNVILYSYDLASIPPGEAGMPVPKDKLKVFFYVAEGVDKPLEQWLADARNDPSQPPPPAVLSTLDTTLGGKTGVVQVVEDDNSIKHKSYYIRVSGARVFVVNAVPGDSQVWPEFERILASLRFAP